MTLARRLIAGALSILLILLLLTITGWLLVDRQGRSMSRGAEGLRELSIELRTAVAQNQRLRSLLQYSLDLATARAIMVSGHVDDPRIDELLATAVQGLTPISSDSDLGEQAKEARMLVHEVLLARAQEPGSRERYVRDHLIKLYRAQNRVNALGDALLLDSQRVEQRANEQARLAAALERNARNWRRWAGVGLLSLTVVLGVVATVTAGRQYQSVIAPLSRLGRGVREIAAGRFTSRLEPERDEEFAALVREFNRMAQELDDFYHRLDDQVRRQSAELARAERLASVGFLAAGVAHEINNPLAIISGHAELALRKLARTNAIENEKADLVEMLDIVRDESMRCKTITTRLLELAADRPTARQQIDLESLVRQCVDWMRQQRRSEGVQWEVRIEPTPPSAISGDGSDRGFEVTAIAEELRQVVMNLLNNAAEAVDPRTGRVEVVLSRDDDRSVVGCCVIDDGVGMSSDELDRVFEPFFSGKKSRGERGMGLGLSISHAIIAKLGGRLWASSEGRGRGSRFGIELPAAEETDPPTRSSDAAEMSPQNMNVQRSPNPDVT